MAVAYPQLELHAFDALRHSSCPMRVEYAKAG